MSRSFVVQQTSGISTRDSSSDKLFGLPKQMFPVKLAKMASDSATFRKHLQRLPQELFDDIYDLSFGALEEAMWPKGQRVVLIGDEYRTPKILHIDRKRRLQHVEQYYKTARFEFVTVSHADSFLNSIGAGQRKLLGENMRLHLRSNTLKYAMLMRTAVKALGSKYGLHLMPIIWYTPGGYLELCLDLRWNHRERSGK